MADSLSFFMLGATGYLGSQFLVQLAKSCLPKFHIRALVRKPVEEKVAQLKAIYSNISVVEGTLEDDAVIREEASRANYVINCASADHLPSVVSILEGLTDRLKLTGIPPVYIHISGQTIASDNSRGENVELDKVPCYTDVGLDLNALPPTNMHLDVDKLILKYGTRNDNPIRTLIIFPAYIYGIGEGVTKITRPIKMFIDIYKNAGHAGTWGFSRVGSVHVKDCADAIVVVLKATLEGAADERGEGLYFASINQPMVQFNQMSTIIGDIMHRKGLLPVGGTKPFCKEITDSIGHAGWTVMGGNHNCIAQRLRNFGWEATESKKVSLLESLPVEMEEALQSN